MAHLPDLPRRRTSPRHLRLAGTPLVLALLGSFAMGAHAELVGTYPHRDGTVVLMPEACDAAHPVAGQAARETVSGHERKGCWGVDSSGNPVVTWSDGSELVLDRTKGRLERQPDTVAQNRETAAPRATAEAATPRPAAPAPAPVARATPPAPVTVARATPPTPAPVARATPPAPAPVARATQPAPVAVARATPPAPAPRVVAQAPVPSPAPHAAAEAPRAPRETTVEVARAEPPAPPPRADRSPMATPEPRPVYRGGSRGYGGDVDAPNAQAVSLSRDFPRPDWCGEARFPHERLVCSDPELADRDLRVRALWRPFKQLLSPEEVAWNKRDYFLRLRACGADRDCIASEQQEQMRRYRQGLMAGR